MSSELEVLFIRNNICNEKFKKAVYDYFILSIFEDIFNYLQNKSNKNIFIKELRNTSNREKIIKEKILEVTNINLNDNEIKKITELCIALINKKDYREIVSNQKKEILLINQKYKCKLCKKTIDINSSHYDHIVPWVWVGDELNDNYQMLCTECNLKKSDSIIHEIKYFLKNNSCKN